MKQTNSRPSAGERARVRRLKAAYRKRMLIVGVIFFILGIVAGALVHSWYAGRHEVTATPAVSPAPVADPEDVRAEAGHAPFPAEPPEGQDAVARFGQYVPHQPGFRDQHRQARAGLP